MADPIDPFGGLTGADRSAAAYLTNILKSYGLESLAPVALGYIKQGYSQDTIAAILPETPEYKKRFSANETRKAKGLPVLTPSEYLATEEQYRQIMSTAGLPPGFYDQPDDFTKFLENDTSPSEIQGRVKAASDLVDQMDPSQVAQFGDFYNYTHGDLVAYALDQERSVPIIEKQIAAAKAGAAGHAAGLDLTRQQAEGIGALGLSDQQIQSGVATAARAEASTRNLAEIYGGQYTADQALSEVFQGNGLATQERKRLASQERAQFGGSANTNGSALSRRDAGRI
jgi:hypothetical protein